MDPNTTRAGGRVGHRARPVPHLPTDIPASWGGWPPSFSGHQSLLPQRALEFDYGDYVVVDGIAQGVPALGALSRSTVYARSWDTDMNLGAAEDIDMAATSRWLPDTADLVARPDLGATTHVWDPHYGASPGWKYDAATAPYVDPDYQYWASHKRRKTTQAMVFNGDTWMQGRLGAAETAFAFIFVAVLHHPRTNAWQDILASPSAETDPHKATDTTLRYHNGRLQSHVTGKNSEAKLHPPIRNLHLRPTIVLWSEGPKGGTLGVVTSMGRHFHDYSHVNKAGFDLRMFLANNGGAPSAANAADIDMLEISYYDHRLTTATGRKHVVKLDRVYGVSGR